MTHVVESLGFVFTIAAGVGCHVGSFLDCRNLVGCSSWLCESWRVAWSKYTVCGDGLLVILMADFGRESDDSSAVLVAGDEGRE